MIRIKAKFNISWFRISFYFLLFLIFSLQTLAKSSENSEPPQKFIHSFINWYVVQITDNLSVLEDENMKKYVAQSTLERLQGDIIHGTLPDEIDYFLKVQDFDSDIVLATLHVYPETNFGETIIVPVSFTAIEGSSERYLVFYLRKGKTDWEIIKVEKNTI